MRSGWVLGLSLVFTMSLQPLAAQHDGLSPLRTNQFLWGQVTGCVVRFREYSRQITAAGTISKEQLEPFVSMHLGKLDEHLSTLLEIGRENGGIADTVGEDVWVSLISDFAGDEYSNGSAWVQAVGCYKILRDFGLAD
jgi:hypothetical protein